MSLKLLCDETHDRWQLILKMMQPKLDPLDFIDVGDDDLVWVWPDSDLAQYSPDGEFWPEMDIFELNWT